MIADAALIGFVARVYTDMYIEMALALPCLGAERALMQHGGTAACKGRCVSTFDTPL